ncbi:MAG: ATP phosphoribosyltransferase regulatory subunit, partial [Minicystis sp.]
EVAALRPDMTPQIARMVATRLGREPWPIRLCYEGTIVRRRQGRARRHRQVPQAGVELYGAPSPEGDLEVLRLAASALLAAGLRDFVVDLGHASIARALLDPLPAPLAAEVSDALAHKDDARIRALLARAPAPLARALEALPDLHGGGPGDTPAARVFSRARPLFAGTAAASALDELEALWTAAHTVDEALGASLRLDLGEVRGFAYYTGAIFHLLAEGPGEPIGAGGRYDDLLARFDAPMPAVGFALHLDAVTWALEAAGERDAPPPSVLVALGEASARVAGALRDRRIAAAVHPADEALAYARAWHFTHLVEPALGGLRVVALGALGEGAGEALGLEALCQAALGSA